MTTHERVLDFLTSLVAGVQSGDMASIAIVSLVGVLLIRLLLPKLVFQFLVRVVILGVEGLAVGVGFLYAHPNYASPVGEQPERFADPLAAWIVLAVGGLLILITLAVMISASREEIRHRGETEPVRARAQSPTFRTGPTRAAPSQEQAQAAGPAAATPHQQGGLLAQFGMMDPTQRQSVFSTVAFMFIAEFGVFSSVTITAPDATVGAAFFILFHLAAVAYIGTSWAQPKEGLKHYAIVAVASVVVALLLYYTWTQDPVPFQELLPWQFFKEPTMVASVTGVAFSLIISAQG